jgi:hypothetical protein
MKNRKKNRFLKLLLDYSDYRNRGSLVGSATRYGIDGWGLISGKAKGFVLLQKVQTDYGVHPGSSGN